MFSFLFDFLSFSSFTCIFCTFLFFQSLHTYFCCWKSSQFNLTKVTIFSNFSPLWAVTFGLLCWLPVVARRHISTHKRERKRRTVLLSVLFVFSSFEFPLFFLACFSIFSCSSVQMLSKLPKFAKGNEGTPYPHRTSEPAQLFRASHVARLGEKITIQFSSLIIITYLRFVNLKKRKLIYNVMLTAKNCPSFFIFLFLLPFSDIWID